MKMIYRPRINVKEKVYRKYYPLGLIVVSIFILYLFSISPLYPIISQGLHFTIKPILKSKNSIQSAISTINISSKEKLLKENLELKSKLNEATATVLSYNILKKENEELKNVLGRKSEENLLLASVLSKPNHSVYDTVLVDVGVQNEVLIGMLVLGYENVPLGKIVNVYSNTSLVRLFSSPGEEINVEIGEERVPGVAHGIGGGNFRILLPKGIVIKLGEIISLPDISPNALGIVEKIDELENDTFVRIYFKSPLNIYTLSRVLIVK